VNLSASLFGMQGVSGNCAYQWQILIFG